MGFYFKVAPGVKIRAGSRRIRASVGPRAARIDVGAGGPGTLAGVGPVSLYRSAGGGRGGRRGTGQARTSIGAHERLLRQAALLQQTHELLEGLHTITNLHREEFPVATAPVMPEPLPVDRDAIIAQHEHDALRDLSAFKRSARAAAREQARKAALQEIEAKTAEAVRERDDMQRALDEQWGRLLANDPEVIFETLTAAFEDDEARAAVAAVHEGEVSVVVLAPGPDAIPEWMPQRTEAGDWSFRKQTQADLNSHYVLLICVHVLVAVREAFAVAPALTSVRVVVLRRTAPSARGISATQCLLAAVFGRNTLRRIQWNSADAARIVQDASADLRFLQGPHGEIRPLDLSKEPDLWALAHDVDFDQDKEEAAVRDMSVAAPAGPVKDNGSLQAGSGITDPALAPMAGLGGFRQCMDQLTKLTNEYAGHMIEAAPQIDQAETPDEKLIVLDKLADQLVPIVDRYSVQARNYQRLAGEIDREARARLREIRATPRDKWSDGTPNYLESIRRVAETSLSGISVTQSVCDGIDGLKGMSPSLDKPVQCLQSAIGMMSGCRGIFENWLRELEDFGPSGSVETSQE
jgi:hypothetical protein